MPGPPNGETAHNDIRAAVHNEVMASNRNFWAATDKDSESFRTAEIPCRAGAANDPLSQSEIEQLDSSAGSYERIRQIRRKLRRSDMWIAVGAYLALAFIAFVVI